MNRQLFGFGLALAALYLGERYIQKGKTRGFVETRHEVTDDAFAVANVFGKYIRCETADGAELDDNECSGCGVWGHATEFRPALVTGCPGDLDAALAWSGD